MGFCVVDTDRKMIAWCNEYSSACTMAQTWGGGVSIIKCSIGIHRDIVNYIRKSW